MPEATGRSGEGFGVFPVQSLPVSPSRRANLLGLHFLHEVRVSRNPRNDRGNGGDVRVIGMAELIPKHAYKELRCAHSERTVAGMPIVFCARNMIGERVKPVCGPFYQFGEGYNLALRTFGGFKQLRPTAEDLEGFVGMGFACERDVRLWTFADHLSQGFAARRSVLQVLPYLGGRLVVHWEPLSHLVACLNRGKNLKEMWTKKEAAFGRDASARLASGAPVALFKDAEKRDEPRVAQNRLEPFGDIPFGRRRLRQRRYKRLWKVAAGEPVVFGLKLLCRSGTGLAPPVGFHGCVRSSGLQGRDRVDFGTLLAAQPV